MVYAITYLAGVAFAAVRWTRGGHFFPRADGRDWEWYDTVFLVGFVIPIALSGALWLAGEVVRGFREPPTAAE